MSCHFPLCGAGGIPCEKWSECIRAQQHEAKRHPNCNYLAIGHCNKCGWVESGKPREFVLALTETKTHPFHLPIYDFRLLHEVGIESPYFIPGTTIRVREVFKDEQ